MTFAWTDEVVEKCKDLNAKGLTFQAIADEVGLGLTRNMVIGKLRRLGLPKRAALEKPKPEVVKAAQRPRTPNKTVVLRPPAAPVAPLPIPASPAIAGEPVHILDLQPHHCRAVLDQRGDDDLAFFCGAPKVVGSSYCAPHTALFTSPLKDSGQTSNRK